MKDYSDVVNLAAKQAWYAYLGGSNEIWRQVDFSLIAYIYEKLQKEVEQDITRAYNVVSDEHYSKFAK